MKTTERSKNRDPQAFVTLSGLPLHFELSWPIHPSSSGSDWKVLHGTALLMDSSGLRAEFAGNLSQVAWEALPSLEPEHAEPIVINAVRQAADNGMLEFLKTSKRQPVPISSRHYSVRKKAFEFAHPSEAELREFVERKIFWLGREAAVWIADPYDALYLNTTPERLVQLAAELSGEGMTQLQGEFARASSALAAQEGKFREVLHHTLERAVAKY
ncbi:MAG: hypothetical protein L0Z53_14580 [Acidobacteriales bacterium]|nr:hypothetical protein [Terriglobales bacterium]